jgi:hypothetical protein
MSRPKKPSVGPGNTSHLFGGRKPAERGGAMTRERIAEDMETFRKAGGRIEKLGVTATLTRIGTNANTPAPPTAPVKAAAKPRR